MKNTVMINQNGYTLLRRGPLGQGIPVEVWRQSDDALCHTAPDMLRAWQWAHANPPPAVVEVDPRDLLPAEKLLR